MTRSAIVLIGAVGLAAAQACGQAQLQRLSNRIEVEPLRIARAVHGPDGTRMVGEWVEYSADLTRACAPQRVFDCLRRTTACDDDSYFFFGSAFCAAVHTDDMTVGVNADLDRGLDRMEFAWYWTGNGFGSERCIVAAFTQDSVPCEPDSYDYPGWLLDFGNFICNPGGYYVASIDLSSGTWPMPSGGTGSYVFTFARDVTSSGALVLASCAQPMLWATGEDRGDPLAPGTQNDLLFSSNDLEPHDADDCVSGTVPFCPFELGVAAAFSQSRCVDCEYADVDGDGAVTSRDFAAYLNRWAVSAPEADCDGDGSVNTNDMLCYLQTWSTCR